VTVAKVFKDGRSQAIRLPREYRVEGSEVYLKRTSGGFLVIPRDPWEVFFEGVAELSEEFFRTGRVQPDLERRAWQE
jgi:antitoxin VapB